MSKIVDYRIVISENARRNEVRAAGFLRENIKLVCGKTLEIVRDSEAPTDLEIVVGLTSRETLDGVKFERERGKNWEYILKPVGNRFYIAGLGTPPDVITMNDDGAVGTVMGVCRFVSEVLKYDFVYEPYECYPETPDLEMPLDKEYELTKEALALQEPELFEGGAMYVLNASSGSIPWNIGSFIFKSKEGRIVVLDGGLPGEVDRFLHALRMISGKEVPHVDAWLLSHLHGDHYSVYEYLCKQEKYKGALTVDTFYCNLCTDRFFRVLSGERADWLADLREFFLDTEKVIADKVVTLAEGDIIKVDELEFEVIHVPDEKYGTQMDINDSSTVYKFTYDKGQTMMLLGDAEFVCENDLVNNKADKLKSDIVQVGHHGCGNVSELCYKLIGAKAYIWTVGERYFYSEDGHMIGAYNSGMYRSRDYMMKLKPKRENIHLVTYDILSTPLPMKIY